LKLTIQTMVHGLRDRKYLVMSMVTAVMFVSHSSCFSVGINSIFFEKVINRVAFDACLKKISMWSNEKKRVPFLWVAYHAMILGEEERFHCQP
jgi:hypothetical protein